MRSYVNKKLVFINKFFKTNDGLKINVCANRTGYWIIINEDIKNMKTIVSADVVEENFEKAYKLASKEYNLIPISDREYLLEYFKETQDLSMDRNRMGCSEDWYDAFFAMKQTFTKEEVEAMSDNELNNLFRLANNIQEGLY